MPKRRPPPFRNSPSAGGATDPDLPSLLELERFTTASLHRWTTAATRVEALHRALYFGLETLRQRDGPRLIDAVRSCTHNDYSIDHWSRIVDYRYVARILCGRKEVEVAEQAASKEAGSCHVIVSERPLLAVRQA